MKIPEGCGHPFAVNGFEKMLYDARQSPVAITHKDKLYVAWGGGNDGLPRPHIIEYDMKKGKWSEAIRPAELEREAPDHHMNPVLWVDDQDRLHMLFGVHCSPGTHIYTPEPGNIERWEKGPQIAPDITYPKIMKKADGTLIMFYRVLAHMGWWTYITSRDGGFSWTKPLSLIDFDRDPVEGEDDWASSYHNCRMSRDGKSLHLGFVYFHERGMYGWIHPIYKVKPGVQTRFDLYYARVDIDSGRIFDIDGNELQRPLSRHLAESAKIWSTFPLLTNIPSLYIDEYDNPGFLLVRSTEEGMRRCNFHYITRIDGSWQRAMFSETNSTWAGSCIHKDEDGNLAAYVIASSEEGEKLTYGGGDIEKWVSRDGSEWKKAGRICPQEGLIYNNPMFAEKSDGSGPDTRFLLTFGWEGPEGIAPPVGPAFYQNGERPKIVCKGRAFVAFNGNWI
ncbi:MAG: BNR-4 repeat-containing protein [Spirochaetales bacterium]|nr:BNR-4 repeat-containing protein [Spirochaetales bacterium]